MKFERRENRAVTITVRLAESERRLAEAAAAAAGVTLSQLVRAALRDATAQLLTRA